MSIRPAALATSLAFLTLVGGAHGVPVRGIGRPGFAVDMIVLPAAADSAELEIQWEVALKDLAFQREDDVYRARYEVAVVFSSGGTQVAGHLWERRVRAYSIAETRDPQEMSEARRTVRLPFGRYDARISVTDRVSGSRSESVTRIDVRAETSEIGLSDLRLVRYTEDGVERNVGHDVAMGEDGHFVRAMLRVKEGVKETVTVRWRVMAPGGAILVARDSTVALTGTEQNVDLPLPREELLPGAHDVEVRLGMSGRAERRQIRFQARLRPAWFAAHREMTLEILKLLSESNEVKDLEAAGEEIWPDSLRVFWERRDPTPGTAPNEFVDQLQERVEDTCTLFVEPFRHPGWRTDRGRAWIRYGRPDRRTQRESEIDRPAAEVWEYDSPHRVLVFVDRGSGEYWLTG